MVKHWNGIGDVQIQSSNGDGGVNVWSVYTYYHMKQKFI